MKKVKLPIIATLAIGLLAGAIPAVMAQEEAAEPIAPVEFTGRIAFGPCPVRPTVELLPGKTTYRGENYCRPGVVEAFSDPRLQGDHYVWNDHDVYTGGPEIWATAFSIVTDEGAWRGIPDVYLPEGASGDQILIGEGAYDGLTVIATVDVEDGVWEWHGWIIEGGLPPLPEEPEAIP